MSSISHTSQIICRAKPLVGIQGTRSLVFSFVVQKPAGSLGKQSQILPKNVEEINSSVKAKFSPHRTRDSSSARFDVKTNQPSGTFGHEFMGSQGSKASLKINSKTTPSDRHVGVYDASNSVSLSSVMQSNVPKPFETKGTEAPPHLGMPGGQWSQGDKYVSGDLHDHHNSTRTCSKRNPGMGYSSLLYFSKKHSIVSGILSFPTSSHRTFSTSSVEILGRKPPLNSLTGSQCVLASYPNSFGFPCINNVDAWCEISIRPTLVFFGNRFFHMSSTKKTASDDGRAPNMTQRQKMRRAVKDYGATVVVFHVAISLASLGLFYLLVSSGIDMSGLIERLGINLATLEQNHSTSSVSESIPPSEEQSESDKKHVDGGRRKAQAVAAGVSTFVLAYAIHKVFAPVRIAITLTATPFIVRHLRKIGVLKSPKGVS